MKKKKRKKVYLSEFLWHSINKSVSPEYNAGSHVFDFVRRWLYAVRWLEAEHCQNIDVEVEPKKKEEQLISSVCCIVPICDLAITICANWIYLNRVK